MTKQEKLDVFVGQLKSRPEVLAIILFGSYARGDSRPDSDIDLVVILSSGYKRAVEHYENQSFEIVYVTEKGASEYWQSHKHDAAALWHVAKILFDRDGTGARLEQVGKAILNEKRPALSADEIAHLRFDQEDALKAVGALLLADPATAKLLLEKKVAALLETYFDLKQQWIPPTKQQLIVLRQEAPSLAALFDSFYGNHSNSDLALVRQIIKQVFAD